MRYTCRRGDTHDTIPANDFGDLAEISRLLADHDARTSSLSLSLLPFLLPFLLGSLPTSVPRFYSLLRARRTLLLEAAHGDDAIYVTDK